MSILMTATKVFNFCYAHHLPDYNGKCKHLHGHNARVEISVSGMNDSSVDEYPSMILDFHTIQDIAKPIIESLDHKNLNQVLPDTFLPPTAENIARYLFNELLRKNLKVHKIRVYETDDSYIDCEWRA